MKLRVPDYYKDFHCLASECKDSCCIGWEIDIDEETLEYYESVPGAFGKRLRENIVDDGEDTSFALRNGRCAFLNDKNLCDICIELGETSLCEICLEYPRFTVEFGSTREKCLGLSCEEAGRLIFEKEEPVTFQETYMEEQFAWQEEEEEYEDGEDEMDDTEYPYLEKVRNCTLEILQNRELSIEKRMEMSLLFAEDIQHVINERNFVQFDEIIDKYRNQPSVNGLEIEATQSLEEQFALYQKRMDVYETLELLDEEWDQVFKRMKSYYQSPKQYHKAKKVLYEHYKRREIEYEHLLVYFIFRYGMKAVYDYNFLEKVKFAVTSFLVIRDMDAERFTYENSFQLKQRIDVARIYSKEVEHSEENLEILAEAFVFEPAFETESLIIAL